jgi:hypothetical protein
LTSRGAVVEQVSQLRKRTGEKKKQGFLPFLKKYNNPNLSLREPKADEPMSRQADEPMSQLFGPMSQLFGSLILSASLASYSIRPVLGGGILILLPAFRGGCFVNPMSQRADKPMSR